MVLVSIFFVALCHMWSNYSCDLVEDSVIGNEGFTQRSEAAL